MDIFISYKYTGNQVKEIHDLIDPIVFILKRTHNVYCNLYDDEYYIANKMSATEIMKHALSKLDDCNFHITINDGVCGEGMAIEFGYAYCKKIPTLLLLKSGIKSISLKALATYIIEYNDIHDLLTKLSDFKINVCCHTQKNQNQNHFF